MGWVVFFLKTKSNIFLCAQQLNQRNQKQGITTYMAFLRDCVECCWHKELWDIYLIKTLSYAKGNDKARLFP